MKKQTEKTQEKLIIEMPKKKFIKLNRKTLTLTLVFVLIAATIYFGKGLLVAAVVNGKPVTRYSVIASLEKTQGKQALDNLVTESLIKQEVAKAKITVTQAEIDAELAKIETQISAQGLTLDAALAQEKITKSDLVTQIKLQKQLEKILSKDITVTDEEIKTYIAANTAYLPAEATPEELNVQARAQLVQQKLSTQYQTWIEGVKTRAKIYYFVNF